ncbi:15104_t:CDS:2 [Entrophospora sp. SA101]|nr:15104_t:CDS:2 [Entrophospora sp. SA101]CAJ0911015.1 6527_t:CDS:2 [Entrophospora sp. SA101]
MHKKQIIYLNELELDFLNHDVINQEISDISTISIICDKLPEFFSKLENKQFDNWKDMATWARRYYFSSFVDTEWKCEKSKDENNIIDYVHHILIH